MKNFMDMLWCSSCISWMAVSAVASPASDDELDDDDEVAAGCTASASDGQGSE